MGIDCKTYRQAITTGTPELTDEEAQHCKTCDECLDWFQKGDEEWREAHPEVVLLVRALVVDIGSNPDGAPKKGRGQA